MILFICSYREKIVQHARDVRDYIRTRAELEFENAKKGQKKIMDMLPLATTKLKGLFEPTKVKTREDLKVRDIFLYHSSFITLLLSLLFFFTLPLSLFLYHSSFITLPLSLFFFTLPLSLFLYHSSFFTFFLISYTCPTVLL